MPDKNADIDTENIHVSVLVFTKSLDIAGLYALFRIVGFSVRPLYSGHFSSMSAVLYTFANDWTQRARSETVTALNHILDNVLFDCSTCNLKKFAPSLMK